MEQEARDTVYRFNGRSINIDELLHYVRTKPSASFWSCGQRRSDDIRLPIQGGR